MTRASRIPHGQQGLTDVNNSTLRHCRHDRSPSCFARFLITLGLAATVCGCHYCPHNRHVLRPGEDCASDYVGNPYACHPGGRRGLNDCVDRSCDQGGSGCTDEQLEAYYPTPDADDAPPAPANVTEEPQQAETSPLTPFAPVENFPPPPTASVEPETVETQLEPAPIPDDSASPIPLFEGRIELNTIEALPLEEPVTPDATLNAVDAPPPPLSAQPDVPTAAEETEAESADENPAASLFRLRLPPRLFRLRDEEDVEITQPPAPPVSEASARHAGSIFGGHSLTPAPTPHTQAPSTPRSTATGYGHSLR